MSLTRAMGSAQSGLNAQQFHLDIIGNNLANATTTGFKAGRADFSTLLSQTIRFGTAPQGQLGGINPMQAGFGVSVASVSRNFNQGALATTGVASDLAIDGNGFFILRNAAGGQLFTRDGTFGVSATGLLADPSTGFLVQGVNATPNFAIPANGPLEDLRIPLGNLQVAQPTLNAVFDGNLNSGGDLAQMGTVLQSAQLQDNVGATPAVAGTLLANLSRATGTGFLDLQIDAGDTLTVSALKGGRPLPEQRFFVGTSLPAGFDGFGTTLGDFTAFVQRALGINTSSSLHYGAIRDNDTNPNTPGVSFSAPAAFVPSTTAAWSFTQPAVDFNAQGVRVGDILRFNTGAGAGQMAQITAISGLGDTLTLAALSGGISLPASGDQYTIHEPAGVSISNATTPWLTDGALHVAGNAGVANHLTNVVIRNGTDNLSLSPFTEIEAATGESVTTNAVVYDSLGNAHTVELTFVLESLGGVDPSTGAVGNTWRLFTEAADGKLLSGGGAIIGANRVAGSGQLRFSTAGQFLSQQAGAAGFVTVNIPNAGATTPLTFAPDFGGMTGFAGDPSLAFMASQDGMATGILTDFSVGQDGIITGIFTNGATRSLGQVYLARFQNPNGLEEVGDNAFRAAANSGTPIIGAPVAQGSGAVVGGALEGSNVDFAKEFSDLIIAQRAFQANARVISRSDELLEELVNIV